RRLAGIHEQRTDAAINIDPRVCLGGAGRIGERVDLVLVLAEEAPQRSELPGALVKREAAQVRPTPLPCVPQHELRVEAIGGGICGDLSRGRLPPRPPKAPANLPLTGHETLQLHGAHSSLTTCPSMR